ncbi:MAG: CpXC domain-containing protein [Anaerolineales bacterium]|jgi:hypothetical protein
MPKTNIECPNCRQTIVADIDRLFDVNDDPTAKQKLLSGAFNIVKCPYCGFQGQASTPIVYHDPDKELLLTFIPPDVNISRDEQERIIGIMINQITNRLPQEKRKGYLLQPQATLTVQGLIERVLEAEGITKEMIQAQQDKLKLIQHIAEQENDDLVKEIIQQEDKIIDSEFLVILQRLAEAAAASGDEETAERLSHILELILETSTFGQQVKSQSEEIEAAMLDLREAGDDLSREKVLDLILNAPNETRLQALVNLVRPVMDYSFFLLLSERIDRARGEGRSRLVKLRNDLIEMTKEYDKQIEAIISDKRRLIEQILSSPDVKDATIKALPVVDEFFLSELNQKLELARKNGDLAEIEKINSIFEIIKEASAPPKEVEFIEKLIKTADSAERQKMLEENADKITPEFTNLLSSVVMQTQESDNKELAEKTSEVYREVLRFSMAKNIQVN